MTTVELTCIGCPLGCNLIVTLEDSKVINVTGNSCKIGLDYAHEECIHPSRIITTTLPVKDGTFPRVAVKTQNPIPKNQIFICMKLLKSLEVRAPINVGDILCKDLAGTGISLVATQTVLKIDQSPS